MRSIKKVHKAEYRPIADLITYSPLPTRSVQQVDPFIFLNHHGPQKYPPNNNGLPFGPHPHRGMETVTFIIDGDIMHKDSSGHESVIEAGGVQWMTAGSGLIHAEVSSDKFIREGGQLEILQLWVNLPAKHKMTEPNYEGLRKEQVPQISIEDGNVLINLVSGKWGETTGAFETLTDIFLSTVYFTGGAEVELPAQAGHNIFFYVIRGRLKVGEQHVEALNLAEFNSDGESVMVSAASESILLYGHAKPFNEPVVAQGPFVMNTEEEIQQAYDDYRRGKFGSWKG